MLYTLLAVFMLSGCVSLNNMADRDVVINDEVLASFEIDPATVTSSEQIMCGIGQPDSGSASFSLCQVVITSDRIEFLTWNKHHPEDISRMLDAHLSRFDSVALVIYGNGASLRQIILRNAENLIILSYGRNEVDIAENTYKLLTEAGIRHTREEKPLSAEVNPEGIAPIIFPLQ